MTEEEIFKFDYNMSMFIQKTYDLLKPIIAPNRELTLNIKCIHRSRFTIRGIQTNNIIEIYLNPILDEYTRITKMSTTINKSIYDIVKTSTIYTIIHELYHVEQSKYRDEGYLPTRIKESEVNYLTYIFINNNYSYLENMCDFTIDLNYMRFRYIPLVKDLNNPYQISYTRSTIHEYAQDMFRYINRILVDNGIRMNIDLDCYKSITLVYNGDIIQIKKDNIYLIELYSLDNIIQDLYKGIINGYSKDILKHSFYDSRKNSISITLSTYDKRYKIFNKKEGEIK